MNWQLLSILGNMLTGFTDREQAQQVANADYINRMQTYNQMLERRNLRRTGNRTAARQISLSPASNELLRWIEHTANVKKSVPVPLISDLIAASTFRPNTQAGKRR